MKAPHILLVDSDPRWIDFVQQDLSRFEIVVARDAETAILELEADWFDLIIVGSQPLDVLENISKRFVDMRVIVVAVLPTTLEAVTAFRLGAVRYIGKSFGRGDLLKYVREIIPLAASAELPWQKPEGDPRYGYDPQTIQNPGDR